ncbi:MAG: ATP-binding cassette domain-containing protein [Bacillota bacterium]|nr:ATP-binding cassette domain-containing protein [Bacillota bacterium]
MKRRYWAIALVLGLAPLLAGNAYLLRVAGMALWLFALALALDVVAGLAGLLDLGFTAFIAVGAYVYAFLASGHFGLHLAFPAALAAGAAAGAVTGLAVGLPSLRLRDDYLAIVTLALGQITRILLVNLDRPVNITNGPNGIIRLDPARIGGLAAVSPAALYCLMLGGAIAALAVVRAVDGSRLGRALRAVRDRQVVAEALGFPAQKLKLIAFIIGSSLMAGAGVLFAAWQGSVFPENFDMSLLIAVYCVFVLGGSRQPAAMLLAAVGLVLVPEVLRGSALYRMVLYGLALAAAVLWREGAGGRRRAKRWAAIMRTAERTTAAVAETGSATPGFPHGRLPWLRPTPPAGATGAGATGRALRVEDLTVRHGGMAAVDQVALSVRPGEVVGLIGPNGAGKTTLFNAVSGVVRPASGKVFLVGAGGESVELSRLPAHRRSGAGIARTFQGGGLFETMTLAENVSCAVQGAGLTWAGRAADDTRAGERFLAAGAPDLAADARSLPGALTYGARRVAELVRAMASEPGVVLLDEPMAGLSLEQVRAVEDLVRQMRAQGKAVLLVEHRMETVFGLCDRVLVLDRGRLVAAGTPSEVAADPLVREVYLGKGNDGRDAGGGTGAAAPCAAGDQAPGGSTARSAGVAAADGTADRLPETPPERLLEIERLTAGYGDSRVLHDVDVHLLAGEVVCVLGPNAAGKSTLLRTITGTARVVSGRIVLDGADLAGVPVEGRIALGLAIVPEGRRLFPGLTVREHLLLGAEASLGRRSAAGQREEIARRVRAVIDLFPHLGPRLEQPASTLSGGEQQMVALGRALASRPKLLLLDEPCMGLAPALAERLLEAVRDLARADGPLGGCGVLLVDQNAALALSISDRAYAMRDGRIILEGRAAELRGADDLRRAYLSA